MSHLDTAVCTSKAAANAEHATRMHRIRNITSLADAPKAVDDAVEAVFTQFEGRTLTTATMQEAKACVRAATKNLGYDCPFRIESNYVGRGVDNPRVIFLNPAQVRVLKTLATERANDFDAWKSFLEQLGCDL